MKQLKKSVVKKLRFLHKNALKLKQTEQCLGVTDVLILFGGLKTGAQLALRVCQATYKKIQRDKEPIITHLLRLAFRFSCGALAEKKD